MSAPGSAREFFDGLEARIDPARVAGKQISYRFDVRGAGSWRLELADGTATVSESDASADCVVETTEDVLLRIVRGEQSPALAYMSGKIKVQGRTELALGLRDLLA
ncbi:MAG: SCP2 sterol-binding domain-containing protein [Gaiellaceae bacterium]